MGRVGRIKASHHQDEIQTKVLGIFYQIVNCILSLLEYMVVHTECVSKTN
jgi:hypothetical protein